ncbi:MAG: DUF3795 domain-containing protein [Candidatus Aminicenantes bacterium]|nr:DUF3795 domain-containing protein [Candidatus Aminicenantes bacterium]
MIAFCGLLCSECGAFLATQNDDDEKRKEVAQLWSKEYDADLKPEDINCEGCLAEGDNLFSYPKICEIRKCGKEKSVLNCAQCDEYICKKLEKFFQMVPAAKERLDKIRSDL